MGRKQTIQGPYKVINIGVSNGMYEVVCLVNDRGDYEELRPRRTYLNRQSAYRRCATLNKRTSEDGLYQ